MIDAALFLLLALSVSGLIAFLISSGSSIAIEATEATSPRQGPRRFAMESISILMDYFFRYHGVALSMAGIVVTLALGLPSLISKVSMIVDPRFPEPFKSAIPSDDSRWMALGKRFIIKNEGSLALNDVEGICFIEHVQYPSGAAISNLGFVGPVRQKIGRLEPSDSSTVQCRAVEGYIASLTDQDPQAAWIGIKVTFRADWAIFHSSRMQTFLCGGGCSFDTCCAAPMFAPPPSR